MGSDVNLAAHLLMDGFQNKYDVAIVVSGDSDLITPIRMVKETLKKPVGVLNPQLLSGPSAPPKHKQRKNAGLKEASSFYRNGITWNKLSNACFPEMLTDKSGTFSIPEAWK